MILVKPDKIADYTVRGWWGTQTLWDLFCINLRTRPDAEAVVDAPKRAEFAHGTPRRLSWAQLADEVDRFCLLLLAHNLPLQHDALLAGMDFKRLCRIGSGSVPLSD